MTWLIARLIGLGCPPQLAKPILAVLAFLALVGALAALRACDKRNIIAGHEAKEQVKQTKRERNADANLEAQKDRDQAAADQRRKEIDNATQGIPDKAPSARQRARACLELRREAKASGRPVPTC